MPAPLMQQVPHQSEANPARTPLDKLLLKGSRVRTFLLCLEGAEYRTYLREVRQDSIEQLLRIKDEKEADRLRGEIRILDRLITLPDVISDYLRGVSNGTFRKITESHIEENKNV